MRNQVTTHQVFILSISVHPSHSHREDRVQAFACKVPVDQLLDVGLSAGEGGRGIGLEGRGRGAIEVGGGCQRVQLVQQTVGACDQPARDGRGKRGRSG